jgi:hypothetical protein
MFYSVALLSGLRYEPLERSYLYLCLRAPNPTELLWIREGLEEMVPLFYSFRIISLKTYFCFCFCCCCCFIKVALSIIYSLPRNIEYAYYQTVSLIQEHFESMEREFTEYPELASSILMVCKMQM